MGLLEETQKTYGVDIEQVQEVMVETGPVAFTSAGNPEPKKGVEAKFSLWFLAALALATGSVTIDKFTDENVADPALVSLRKKVNANLVRELKFGARANVKMADGTEYKSSTKHPKGGPDDPMGFDELSLKFRNSARVALPEESIDPLLERILNLDKVRDIGKLMSLM
ncbi:MAG: MmgE/PrpD family protein [Desulfarculaceae bacterium]|nr:MmgE/PrpD family protein [Desulfarculaceae bacterium]